MVRGCQRRVIFVKNTGSEMFDEALFFIGEDIRRESTEEDMIKEADRIISGEIYGSEERDGILVRGWRLCLKYAATFIIGGLLGALLVALIQ